MRHEDYKQLLALEAVGALDDEERARLEGHLPSCAECREELREMSDAAASLLYTVEPVRPSPRLRSDILARVRAVDPSEPRRNAPVREGPRDLRAMLRGVGLRQIFVWRPALGFGAAAAAIAVLLLGLTSLTLWNRNRSLHAELSSLSERLREAQGELAGQREQLARARDVNEVLNAPEVRVAELSGKKPAPEAHAMLAYDRTTGRAVVMATGLPPCPAGHAYQLWLIDDDKPLPGGTFKADAQGRGRLTDSLPPNHPAPAFAVTLEREGGVPAPEGDMFLYGTAKG